MFDHLTTFFWTIAYLLIAYNGIKYRDERKTMIPAFAVSLNFTWEINAVIIDAQYGRVLWLLIDIIIISLSFYNIRKAKKCKKADRSPGFGVLPAAGGQRRRPGADGLCRRPVHRRAAADGRADRGRHFARHH